MRPYRPPFAVVRWFHVRNFSLHIDQHNVISSCRVRVRDVTLMPNSVHVGGFLDLRRYSGGSLVNRYPENFDDGYSNRAVGISEPDKDQRSHSDQRGGSGTYMQNMGNFQHYTSPRSLHAVNDRTNTQYLGHDAEEAVVQNLYHSSRRNAAASQQNSGPWNTNSEPRTQYPSNLSGGYSHSRPPQQNFHMSVSHNPKGLPQQEFGAASRGHLGENEEENDGDNGSTLEELDAFCKQWDLENAVKSMKDLSGRGVNIDLLQYLALIEACGEAKALEEAKAVHEHLFNFLSPISISTYNRMLETYGKCGSMQDAYNLFNQMPELNLTSWNNMITWFGRNGLGEDAIDMFTKFKETGLKPDGQMFLGVFEACGVVGDVSEGMLHFDSMGKLYGISPTMAHYASIVHMFGSAGDLDGALEFIEKMPVEPSADVWESLMNISRIQGNVELGNRCAQILNQLDPSRLAEGSEAGLLPTKGSESLKKKVRKPGLLDQRQHEYRAGDRSHPENDRIYALLRGMKESMKEAGYVPETRFVLHDIDPEGKEEAIMAHSERLAFAYALMTSKPRAQVRIIKNLRVCGDCHNAFKIFSKLVGREIIMRDAKRFHHFKDGKCSCNDYW